jgi:hypothetical protein
LTRKLAPAIALQNARATAEGGLRILVLLYGHSIRLDVPELIPQGPRCSNTLGCRSTPRPQLRQKLDRRKR